MSEARYRPLKAVAIVIALLLMIPGIDILLGVMGARTRDVASGEGIDARSLVQAADPFETLERIEEQAATGDVELPDAFSREIGLLPEARDVRVDAAGTVVGYVVSGQAEDVLADLIVHMEARAWSAVPLGGVDGVTFVKASGSCTWALATCTQTGESTSVVIVGNRVRS